MFSLLFPFPFMYLRFLSMLFLAQTLIGCQPDSAAVPPAAMPPPQVVISQPLQHDIVEWDEYTGRLEAVESVQVRARVSGYLHEIRFKDGGKVQKGDLLFVIDPRPYRAANHQAEAELERNRSRLEKARNDVARAERLRKEQAISEEEYDTRSKALRQAMAELDAASAAVELTRLNLGYTEVRAPISGRISRKLLTEGNLVIADNTLLATIVSVDPVYVYVDADERSVLKYRRLALEGKRKSARDFQIPLELALIDENEFAHKGYVDYVDPELDPTMGTVRARGVFANPEDLLSPGLFARVRVPGSDKHPAMLISDRAVSVDQGKKFVIVINRDNVAEYRPITTGRIHDGLRIVSSGLTAGDWVVVNGLQFVRPGMKVEPTREAMPEGAALKPESPAQ